MAISGRSIYALEHYGHLKDNETRVARQLIERSTLSFGFIVPQSVLAFDPFLRAGDAHPIVESELDREPFIRFMATCSPC